jgi:hypothetical protein
MSLQNNKMSVMFTKSVYKDKDVVQFKKKWN